MNVYSIARTRIFHALPCLGLAAYFLYDYGVVTGSWVVGALLYTVFLFLVFPVIREVRAHGSKRVHWLDWLRLAYIPVFALCALVFASWLPVFTMTAIGLFTSLFLLVIALWRVRP